MFNDLRWTVIVGFVDIGGIVNHHCLSFLLFCWYWWNCWLSLFKLSFHNSVQNTSFWAFPSEKWKKKKYLSLEWIPYKLISLKLQIFDWSIYYFVILYISMLHIPFFITPSLTLILVIAPLYLSYQESNTRLLNGLFTSAPGLKIIYIM